MVAPVNPPQQQQLMNAPRRMPLPLPGGAEARDVVLAIREARRLLAEAGEAEGPLRCQGCQRAAPFEGSFCPGCGLRLRYPCPRCDAPCRQGDAWCTACGVELARDVVAGQLEALAQKADDERRRREQAPLRAYEDTRVLVEGPVRHVVGTRKDGGRDFVKLASQAQGRRLLENELAALKAVGEHPGVVRVKDHREHDGALVVVFEHVEPTMIRFPIAIPQLLRIVSGVLATLEHVHARGILHCDLKPKHIVLVAREGEHERPVLIDWNIAQAPGPSQFGAYTPLFAAPEQLGGKPLDARTDLYALGVILYLLFTHDRFPAVLEETREPEPLLEVLQAKKAMNRAFLTSATQYGGKFKMLQKQPPQQQLANNVFDAGGAGGDGDELEARRVLGAKYMFTSELQRTHDVNSEIRLTGAILELVRRATAVDPADRYADAATMRAQVDALLARTGVGRPKERA